jgi:hypothetical protein
MRHFLLGLFVLLGCGDDDAAVDAGARDSGAPRDSAIATDSGSRDSGSTADAGAADAGTDAALPDAGTDAGGEECSTEIEDRLAGVCDGRGRIICAMWAEESGGPGAVAQCLPPMGRCARASSCDAAGCSCGDEPECEDDQMCVGRPGGGFACACITP